MHSVFMQKSYGVGGSEHHTDRTCPKFQKIPAEELVEGDGGLPLCQMCETRLSNKREQGNRDSKRRSFNRER